MDFVTSELLRESAPKEPLVVVKDLRKTFVKDGEPIHVLCGMDLEIYAGESISVMGRSGAGKSTLLQILGTLDRPSSGTVTFDGVDVFQMRERNLSSFRGRTIGFVFQFHHLLPEFTTLENAAMPAIIARCGRTESFDRAERYLRRVGLEHRLRHKPGELSGGEQQRVALARALVMQPRLLLADEPTGNLDDHTGQQIFELFQETNEVDGAAVVIVTHNAKLGAAMGRHLVMDAGLLVESEHDDVSELDELLKPGSMSSDAPPSEIERSHDEGAMPLAEGMA